MALLILARHGNTFETGQTPTWVGARTDLPLTAKGEEQGQVLAAFIAQNYAPVGTIATGPLKRTRRFAEILAEKTGLSFSVDPRLCEIDYGLWENKSGDEIKALYGEPQFEAWEKDGIWPDGMNWSPDKTLLLETMKNLLDGYHAKLGEDAESTAVLMTSNGILRFIYTLLTGTPPAPEAKVKTGHYCVLSPARTGWDIVSWNQKPICDPAR